MLVLEVEVILKAAKVGFWNLKLVVCLFTIYLLNSYYLMFYPFVYGDLSYRCIDNPHIWNNSINQCQTRADGKTVKCSKFEYLPGEDFEDTAVAKYDLVCDKYDRKRWDLSCLMIGQMISVIFSSMLVDYYGRKRVLQFSTFSSIIVSISYLFQPNFYTMCLCRIIGSTLNMSKALTTVILLTEVLPIKYVRFATSVIVSLEGLGIALSSIYSMIFPKWQDFILYRIILLDVLMLIMAVLFLEESPKWLLQKSKYTEFKDLVAKMFKQNNTEMPKNIQKVLSDISVEQDSENDGKISEVKTFLKVYMLLKTKRTALRMFSISLSWIACTIVYYALAFGKELFDINLHSYYILNGLSEIPGAITQMTLANCLGYKWTNVVSLVSCAACLYLNYFLKSNASWLILTYINAACTKLFITTATTNLYVWNAQLVPTNLRAIGMGLGSFTGRLSSVPMPILFSYLNNIGSFLPGIVLGTVALIAGIFSLNVPETIGNVPPDDIEEFEALGTKNYTNIKSRRIEMLTKIGEKDV